KFYRSILARTLTSTILAAGATVFLASQASAQSIQDMQKQLEALQAQMADLQQQVKAAKAEAEAKPSGGSDWTVKWKGAPEISSADRAYKMKMRGRLLMDVATGSQDNAVTGAGKLSATEFRAARLGIEGVIEHDFKYKFEADLA